MPLIYQTLSGRVILTIEAELLLYVYRSRNLLQWVVGL